MKKNNLYRKIQLAIIFVIIISSISFSLNSRQVSSILEKGTVKINTYVGGRLVSFGSGFILSREGHIGTNFHVIAMAMLLNGRINVQFQNIATSRDAVIYNWDQFMDFAVIKIDTTGLDNIRPIKLGNSSRMKSLDSIFVSGYPVTGSYKAQKGDLNSIQTHGNKQYFDISVLIDKGNSGGPVVNENGKVIGVSTAFLKRARSVNFVVRINDVKEIIEESLKGKRKIIIHSGKEKENNNTKLKSNLLVKGLTINGNLDKNDEIDWFELNGQEGIFPVITINHDKKNNFDFEIYSDTSLMTRALSTKEKDGARSKVPGRCYIKVWRVKGEGNYTLQISNAVKRILSFDGREQEPNNEQYLATLTNKLNIIGHLDNSDSIDWYELTGKEGNEPTFTISHSSNSNFNFAIYSGNKLTGKAISNDSFERLTCKVPGKCFIKVWRVKGSGDYTIRIEPGMSRKNRLLY